MNSTPDLERMDSSTAPNFFRHLQAQGPSLFEQKPCITPLDIMLTTDDTAAFVHHINTEVNAPPESSTLHTVAVHGSPESSSPHTVAVHGSPESAKLLQCESPTQITASLRTPASKRSKTTAKPTPKPTAKATAARASPTPSAPETLVSDDGAPEAPESTMIPCTSGGESADTEGAPQGPIAEGDSSEQKRHQRMMRNRASAAQSRKRKRQQVEELEAMVASLKESVRALTQSNNELKRDCALAAGKAEAAAPPQQPAGA